MTSSLGCTIYVCIPDTGALSITFQLQRRGSLLATNNRKVPPRRVAPSGMNALAGK